ncbi:MAG: hypothetical protein V1720_17535 [bacterium]
MTETERIINSPHLTEGEIVYKKMMANSTSNEDYYIPIGIIQWTNENEISVKRRKILHTIKKY